MSRTIDAALLALDTELLSWPDIVLEEIARGKTTSSRTPEQSLHLDNWFCVATLREGPRFREHYQGDGRTMLAAVDALTAELVSRRTEPHRWHVSDWMRDSEFVIGCADCEREAEELFDGEVDWVTA
jgi:hypothetical protein